MIDKRKVYDCFCYMNEDLVLLLRLETLDSVVDYFVIAESKFTQSGKPKNLNFNIEKFEKFSKKIRYIVVDRAPGGTHDLWANENFQRNRLADGLYDANENDLMLVSDLDEIPSVDAIKAFNPKYLRGDFQHRYFSYYFNNELIAPASDIVWEGTKITTYKNFLKFFKGQANSVRSYKSSGVFRFFKRALFSKFLVQKISKAGWHFTWILTTDEILQKMDAMAHQENNTLENRQVNHIRKCISEGRDIIVPHRKYRRILIDSSFPQPLISSAMSYRKFIAETES